MNFETLCLHADNNISDEWGTLSMPICQSATFVHKGVDVPSEYSYSRLSNPTRRHLENTVAALEGGYAAYAFSTGMTAITVAMMLFEPGTHVIATDDLYGGALRLFRNVCNRNGIEFDFTDTSDPEEVEKRIRPNTRLIYIESPSNPLMQVTDIQRVCNIAHANGAYVFVDNTFLTPYYQRPFELGADIVLHSGTKYLGGHNDALAGFVVCATKELAERVLYYSKTIGGQLAPFDSFLIERGIKTLPIRMDRISENALKIAKYLKTEPKIKKVYYVGLEDSKGFGIMKKQSRGFGGMISVEVESAELARRILAQIRIFRYAESLGGVDSLITYPMLQTHADVPKEERDARGINDRFLRISVGIENADDLIDDLKQAINGNG
ncbi:MAG: PLP-dependent aspartate aminotransferase family protein [Lachnospiraceae bacterium]|nr:PLP-dependent aspartate aminotransferase family protein [Lachnospiraceae bacterium]